MPSIVVIINAAMKAVAIEGVVFALVQMFLITAMVIVMVMMIIVLFLLLLIVLMLLIIVATRPTKLW